MALKPVLFNAEIALLAKLRELQRRGITGEAPLEVCEALLTIRDSDFVQMAAQEALALFFAWRARSGAWPPLKPALYAEIYCRVVTVDIELWEKAAEGGGATKVRLLYFCVCSSYLSINSMMMTHSYFSLYLIDVLSQAVSPSRHASWSYALSRRGFRTIPCWCFLLDLLGTLALGSLSA